MTDTSITPTESETQLAEQLRVAFGRLNRSLRLTHIDTDLPPSQREVLMAVARVPSIRLSELSQEEGINPTMLSRIVAKLEGSGLVTRTLHYALRHLTNDEQRTLAEATPVLEKIVATLRERQ
jgi:DNA-binding MarR family transcriptional regulator